MATVKSVLAPKGLLARYQKASEVVNFPPFTIYGVEREKGKFGEQLVFLCEQNNYWFKLSLSPNKAREALYEYFLVKDAEPLTNVVLRRYGRVYSFVDATIEDAQMVLPIEETEGV